MIPSAVFVAAVAIQNKFPLPSKLSRNPGSMPKTYSLHMFCRHRESIDRVSRETRWECCVSTVLMAACYWPSNNCIPVQKIMSVSTEANHNRRTMVCAATTLTHSLYQGSPNYGPRAKSDLRKHFTRPQNTFY